MTDRATFDTHGADDHQREPEDRPAWELYAVGACFAVALGFAGWGYLRLAGVV